MDRLKEIETEYLDAKKFQAKGYMIQTKDVKYLLEQINNFKMVETFLTLFEISVVRQLIADGLSNEQIFNILKEM